MKDLEQKLINARPNGGADNDRFVRQTISAVQHAISHETFTAVVRTGNFQNKKFITTFLTTPKLASVVLGLGLVIVASGVTYAAINWFGTDVKTDQMADKVYSIAVECSPSEVQALQGNKSYTNTAEYKILKPQLITQEDLKLDVLSTCEQRAVEGGLRKSMPAVYLPGDSHDGLYYPVGKYGTVVGVSENKITVAGVPMDHQTQPREIVTVTLTVNAETLITDRGRETDIKSFKLGDPVYFIFQNPVRTGQYDADWRALPSTQSTVRAIATTQYNAATIKEKVFEATSKGAVEIIKKSDAYGG